MAIPGLTQQGPSVLGTVQTWYNGLPLCTKATFSLISAISGIQLFTGWYGTQATAVALVPQAVLYDYQVYRLLTAVLIHGGLLHVTFNMLAFVAIGASLERAVGSLQLLHFLLLSCLLEGALFVTISALLTASGLVPGAMYTGAMGFSGVIFGLVVWDSALSPASHRSIVGLFHVPAAWYPWVLLLFCQLLLPEASFLGHLAGLLVGQLWAGGYLRALALPRSTTTWLEQSFLLARCVRLPSFILMPSSALPYNTYDTARAGGSGSGGGGTGSGGGSGVQLGGLGKRLLNVGKLLQSGGWGAGAGGDGGGSGSGSGGNDLEAAGESTSESHGRGAFVGTGRVLGAGSGSGSGTAAVAAAQPPNVAAALAAEARMGGGGGGGNAASTAGGGAAGGGGGGGKGGPARDNKALKF